MLCTTKRPITSMHKIDVFMQILKQDEFEETWEMLKVMVGLPRQTIQRETCHILN